MLAAKHNQILNKIKPSAQQRSICFNKHILIRKAISSVRFNARNVRKLHLVNKTVTAELSALERNWTYDF